MVKNPKLTYHKGKQVKQGPILSRIVTLFIPESVSVDTFKNDSYWGRYNRFHKLLFIISTLLIFRVVSKVSEEDFIQLKSSYLQSMIGAKYTKASLHYLLDAGIIESDRHFIIGRKSIGYRIAPAHRNKVRPCPLPDGKLKQKMLSIRQEKQAAKQLHQSVHKYLKQCLYRVTLAPSFQHYVNNFIGNPYNTRLILRNRLDEAPFFKLSAKAGRFYSAITNMPKDMRSMLLIDGEETTEIDLGSSQLYFALNLYPQHSKERQRYHKALQDGIYELVNQRCARPYKNRDYYKTKCIAQIFYKKTSEGIFWDAFKKEFPELAALITSFKKLKSNVDLAYLLQKAESDTVILDACEKLMREGIPVATVHDSILCKKSDSKFVAKTLEAAAFRLVGEKPVVKVA